MRKEVATFRVNGQSRDAIVTPNMTLADVVRDTFQLTGTKESCRCAECGSCTVLVDGMPMLGVASNAVSFGFVCMSAVELPSNTSGAG